MLNRIETIERLNKEKDYEDRLVKNLTHYFIDCLNDIPDINGQERKNLEEYLNIIKFESMAHSELFNKMIQKVMENGQNNY